MEAVVDILSMYIYYPVRIWFVTYWINQCPVHKKMLQSFFISVFIAFIPSPCFLSFYQLKLIFFPLNRGSSEQSLVYCYTEGERCWTLKGSYWRLVLFWICIGYVCHFQQCQSLQVYMLISRNFSSIFRWPSYARLHWTFRGKWLFTTYSQGFSVGSFTLQHWIQWRPGTS